MKITIIGYSGSGKSTLAQTIGQRKHIPVLHLDQVTLASGMGGTKRDRRRADRYRISGSQQQLGD